MSKPEINYFSSLKPDHTIYNIIAFDTEDNGQGAPDNFMCACFYSKDKQWKFTNRSKARKFMLAKRNRSYKFVAHNLLYDLMNLDFPEGDIALLFAKGRLICGQYAYGDKKYTTFLDSGNFYSHTSIEELGKLIGFEKLSFDVKRIKNKTIDDLDSTTKEEMITYCMRDAEITFKVMNELQEECQSYNTGFRKVNTSASLALKIFRTEFMKDKQIQIRPKDINNYERLSYYGGRTEAFNYNKFPIVNYIDINSSYPYQMLSKNFPNPSCYQLVDICDYNTIKSYHGIALVTISVPKMRIPPLPYRYENKLVFPYGLLKGCWTIPELNNAIECGCIINKVHKAIIYNETIDIFRGYVTEFYKKKNETDGIRREFYKLLLNGLSGKFGEKHNITFRGKLENMELCKCEFIWDETLNIRNPESDNGICSKCNKIHLDGTKSMDDFGNGWITIESNKTRDSRHTFPILIAYVTAYGRIQLHKQLISCNSIYADTDSVVSTDIDDTTSLGNELGQWKAETLYDFQAYVPKVYDAKTSKCKNKECPEYGTKHLHSIHKIKGVPKNYKQITALKYTFERPLRLSEAIRRHEAPNKWIEDKKTLQLIDTKRVRLADGTSEPIYINDTRDIKTFEDLIKIQGWNI